MGDVAVNTVIVLLALYFCKGNFRHDWKYFALFGLLSIVPYVSYKSPHMYFFFVAGYCLPAYVKSDFRSYIKYWKWGLVLFVASYIAFSNMPWPPEDFWYDYRLKQRRAVEFMCEKMILSFFWSSMSKLQPLGQMSRRSVWFFSTLGFWQERIGSQKNNRVSTFPLLSRSIALISANSPPLSVKINGKYVLKERPASENRLLRKWNCFAVSEALLESIKRPNMKLQELKIKVRMTLPPMRPMTVSTST